jgi:hypothetical protein
MKILILSFTFGALVILTSACGNIVTNPVLGTSSSGLQAGATTNVVSSNANGTSGLDLAEQCSEAPNVVSTGMSESIYNEYHACDISNGSTAGVKIFGEDQTTKTVCIFPANQNNGQATVFLMNPEAAIENAYAVQCVSVNSNSGTTMAFPNLTFNSVYVVDQADVQSMAECLSSGELSACAANNGFSYSFGQFR